MGSITTASLKVEGIEGISQVLSFRLSQFPGEHATASLEAVMSREKKGWEKEGELHNRWVRVLAEGEKKPLFSGRVEQMKGKEERGYHQVSLELVSGTVLLDQKKESHSYQDAAMSYGSLFQQVAEQAGGALLYPASLDAAAIGFPQIQYEETDWAFLQRMASHFGLSLYPWLEGRQACGWVCQRESRWKGLCGGSTGAYWTAGIMSREERRQGSPGNGG